MSNLRGKKPTSIEKRLKAFFYGGPGVGKTTAAISFPAPYLIDTERGAENDQYVKLLNDAGGAIFQTSDFDEIIKECKLLLSEKHEYKTLIIDPLTIVYNDLLDKCSLNEKGEDNTAYGRHRADADKRIKRLLNILLKLDMNVIITAHSKTEYQMQGDKMEVIGQTFDCYKKLDYLFDIVFEIQKIGKERSGIIRKSRNECFPHAMVFPFSYDEIAERYGRALLEKDTIPQKLATQEQITRLRYLIDIYKEPKEVVQKWLDKANCEVLEEMREDIVLKLISHMEGKLSNKQPENEGE